MVDHVRRMLKFPVQNSGLIDFPSACTFRYVGVQNRKPVIWSECTVPESGPWSFIGREILLIGTGQNIPDGTAYIGTVHIDEFIWHIYENRKL